MIFDAIVVAAGSGSRAGGAKQWRLLGSRPVVRWSVEAFLAAGAREVVVAIPSGERAEAEAALAGLPRVRFVVGGDSRSASVRNALGTIEKSHDPILIHDAARPFLTPSHITALLAALQDAEGAVLALPLADTLKRGAGDLIVETPARDGLWRAQTPQAFRRKALLDAVAAWPQAETPTDDAAVLERAGGSIKLVAGDPRLFKLTYPEDFAMAEALAGSARELRVGQGFDAHRWGPGQAVRLCGVEIPHDRALVGHSDADAGLHAVTDAILGALGEGDIGVHFPPSDAQWKGASSDRFLTHAARLARERGGRIVNVDVTLVCERPKIGPHREAMRARLAEILGVAIGAVSVKATTTEGMGFTGREEGLAAQAVVSLELPPTA
jgi:2-C-methyl-D-erythritol 4-phosphate cytidylyltransferase/2-C-methyl-D-erythritol 2,4-cyclodiphosphate synthase